MTPRHRRWPGAFAFVIAAFVLGGGAAMTAQTGATTTTAGASPRTIEKGDHSNVDSAMQALVRTEAEWTAVYRKHNFDKQPPKVDFSKEMVLAVFMGSRPTAGFNTTILDALEAKGVLVVHYNEKIPSPGAMTAQVLTAPFHIVAIPKATVNDFKFEKVNR
jgi:PrcB C-terminal